MLLAQLQSLLYLHPHSPLKRLFVGLTLVTLSLLVLFPLLHTRFLFPLLQFLKIQFYLSTSTPTLDASLFYFACVPMYTYYTYLYNIYVNMCMCASFRWNRILTVSDGNTLPRFVLLCNSSCRSGHLSGHWECLVVEIAKVFLTYSHLRLCDW